MHAPTAMKWILQTTATAVVLASATCAGSDKQDPPTQQPPDAAVMADAGVTPDAGGVITEPLTAEELAALSTSIPSATRKVNHPITHELLDEDDITAQNTVVAELQDASGNRVGFARDMFIHVNCVSGSCHAIRFVLVFGADASFLDVYHPASDSHDFMKFWENQHTAFTPEDRAKLKTILTEKPDVLSQVTDSAVLVVGATATAPTQPVYQPHTVRGAVFTCWRVLNIMLDTQRIIPTVVGGAGGHP